ncbi:MAG TPA: selenocysteine-specific translation elongation factor [Jatrophihabitantaceae bacterium]|jgi:selenocysteine-specific elongation factor
MHVIATAGHVDHGKSTLVGALTGMQPDRWAEERERGMTIDLGYAWTTLANGAQVAFVDVPGHRRFVSNMLAGVGAVPAVLFVVAADSGWCAQSAEHLDAIDAFGVRHGLLAITRADLGDAELAEQEARTHLAGTPLAGMEAVAVSPVTGLGIEQLRLALIRLTDALPSSPPRPTRLWVDRSFTIRGAGTVVTGTLTSGSMRTDQEVEVVPQGTRVRIRSIETLKASVRDVAAVARVAVNLRGVKPSDIPRGSALVAPGTWAVTSSCDVRLVHQAEVIGSEATCHFGSASVTARVRPLGDDTARLTLARAAPLAIGDRGLLRAPGGSNVLAGVVVLDPYPPPLRARGSAQARAEELAVLIGAPDSSAHIETRGAVRRDMLHRAGVLAAGAAGPDISVERGEWIVARQMWARWREDLLAAVDRWAAANPLRPGLLPATAAQQLDLPDVALVALLVAEQEQLVIDGDGVHRRGVVAMLPREAEQALVELLDDLDAQPFAAREAPALAASGLTEAYLATAVKQRRLIRISGGVYLRPDAPDRARAVLAGLPQPFTVSAARQALGTTRRVALPLLEELDRRRLTRRVDEQLRTTDE